MADYGEETPISYGTDDGDGEGGDSSDRTRTMSSSVSPEFDEIAMYEQLKREEVARLEREAEILRQTMDSYREVFDDYPTETVLEISRRERLGNLYLSSTLSYGEILFAPFQKLLLSLYKHGFNPDMGGKFVDLGAGIGTAVFAACLCHQFHSASGIEILSSLYKIADKPITEKWRKVAQNKHKEKNSIDLKFWLGDAQFLDIIWVDADVVFAHWTAFGNDLVEKYSKIAVRMKPRTFFISISHKLSDCALFTVLEKVEVDLHWGKAVAYIQQRSDVPDPTVVQHPRIYLDQLKAKWLF